ncbi:hypothetical protein DFJ73DRAFT_807580, partial [Zopfochytrium polystomum]
MRCFFFSFPKRGVPPISSFLQQLVPVQHFPFSFSLLPFSFSYLPLSFPSFLPLLPHCLIVPKQAPSPFLIDSHFPIQKKKQFPSSLSKDLIPLLLGLAGPFPIPFFFYSSAFPSNYSSPLPLNHLPPPVLFLFPFPFVLCVCALFPFPVFDV